MKFLKMTISAFVAAAIFCCGAACSEEPYYDDSVREADKVAQIDGNEMLTLKEETETLLLENKNTRLVLNKDSGAVRELANKQTGVYLVRDSENSIPLAIEYLDGRFSYGFRSCVYSLSADSAETAAVTYEWEYARGLKVVSTISLEREGTEVKFSLDLYNNLQEDSVLAVEYPYLADVGQLYSAETDKFFHPYASGYVFDNPVKLFNREDFNGIQWYMGLYPYGFGSTMQFMSYYVENYGGFHLQTYDKGYTVKSFLAVGTGEKLRLGIRHYLNDICSGDKEFYEIGISNLTEGVWTESCNKYYDFAQDCPWSQKQGKLDTRSAEDRAFYEETTLVNFAPHIGYAASAWNDWENTYAKIKQYTGNGKIFNIIGNDWQRLSTPATMNGEMDSFFPAVVNQTRWEQMKNGGYTAFFEFNNLYNVNAAADNRELRVSQATKDRNGNPQTLADTVDPTISWWYMCPSESWYEFSKAKTDVFTEEYGADFLYHDCGYCVAPRTCFDTTHAHGTRVNIIEDEIAFLDKLSAETGRPVGEELISEVFVGTVGYYQARANAGGMGFMDINDIRIAVEENEAHKVPAFDYIYHEYGVLRTDGYMKPLNESGEMYYAIMAFTALNGGVPQFNYEYLKASFNTDEMNEEMLEFLNTLGSLKTGAAKNYLVYGKMLRAPNTGAGTREIQYLNTSAIGSTVFRGTAVAEKIITSAYSYGGKTAVLLCNVTAEQQSARFILHAERDYGVREGKVILNGKTIGKISEGKAKLTLNLNARSAEMLEIVSE